MPVSMNRVQDLLNHNVRTVGNDFGAKPERTAIRDSILENHVAEDSKGKLAGFIFEHARELPVGKGDAAAREKIISELAKKGGASEKQVAQINSDINHIIAGHLGGFEQSTSVEVAVAKEKSKGHEYNVLYVVGSDKQGNQFLAAYNPRNQEEYLRGKFTNNHNLEQQYEFHHA